jgi:glycosyltransferase involved in cell wall biosynthesis
MRVLAKLDEKGFTNWKFIWVGGGDFESRAQQLAEELGLSDRVNLLGFVPWDDALKYLHTSDLFLLNSLSEGMPRSVIEAIACGLPVIGTDVGGVSELLHQDDIVEPMQDDILADKLYEVLTDPERLTEMSKRNLKTSEAFSTENLHARKLEFYSKVKIMVADLKKRTNSANQD